MKELVAYIARALVSKPDEVEVIDAGREGDTEILELRVAAEDRGKVIGKKGRTAHAIRTVMAAASLEGHSYTLEIVD
jgi:predicted RNA-binding protein YlqC (UPF0109 family)